ncbi:GCN5-related N-acetyltransferase domain protein [mine drainage metagenome]|uniref:GCN5-related N-acetyltransferase domain protein n=1 Tax=mine drainage metagenome TaxID=410659 RepID=T1D4N9_9ZZZZ
MEKWFRKEEEDIASTDPSVLIRQLPREYGHLYAAFTLRGIRQHRGFILVAERAGHPVGFLSGIVVPMPPATMMMEVRPWLEGYVLDVYVEAKARGQGIAGSLFTAAERRFRAWGCDHVAVNVLVSNRIARRAYRSMGYSEWELKLHKQIGPPIATWEQVRRRRRRMPRGLSLD